jgi:uncharacterized membrane protein YdjX (TVP38/TMEM64 family)
VAVAAAVIYGASRIPVEEFVREFRDLGVWGSVAFVAAYVVATVLFVPGWVLSVTAGAAFGFLEGFALVVVGANAGAVAAFLTARALGRKRLERRLGDAKRIEALDRAVARKGFRVVLLLRLSHFPYNALNYLLGLTRVSLRDYGAATLLGMLPGIATVVYVGSVVGSVAAARDSDRGREPVEWALIGVGVVAAVVCAVVLTRMARRTVGNGAWT